MTTPSISVGDVAGPEAHPGKRENGPRIDLPWTGWIAGVLSLTLLAGCTSAYYRNSADREAYTTLQGKTEAVPNTDPKFTIEQTNAVALGKFPVSTNAPAFLGSETERERGASVLRLDEALDIAIHHSRTFQNRKEQLFLSALSLTLARHRFAPLFSASGDATYNADLTDHLAETHEVGTGGKVGVDWLIRDLGRLSTALTVDFTHFLSGGPSTIVSSQLGATLTRPLLRNSGYMQEKEALTQAERNLLFDLRDFTQYRKDFTVQVARSYYNVLGSRDNARNSYLNLQSSRKNAERARATVAEGRTTTAELGRLEQQELSAESSWIGSIRSYRQALDNFVFLLGLSVETRLVLDERELETLEIRHPDISLEDAIRVALAGRLDYLNTKDRLEDEERNVKLVANALLPQADLVGGVKFTSNPENRGRFTLPEMDRQTWNAGLNIDLGLDRKSERNSYRTALINYDRAERAVEQQEDQIRLDMRDSWRTLDQAKRNYEISNISVKLAERRVEEQNLLADLGRARAQDQVDAQNDLISSKNQRTQALVTHTIARLQFWNNMGILYIKDNGQWEEPKNEKGN